MLLPIHTLILLLLLLVLLAVLLVLLLLPTHTPRFDGILCLPLLYEEGTITA